MVTWIGVSLAGEMEAQEGGEIDHLSRTELSAQVS